MLRGIGLAAKVATALVVPLALGTGAFAVEMNQQQVEEAARATSQIRSAVRAAVQDCSSAECTQTRTRTRAKTRTKSKAMTQTKNRAKAAVQANGQTTMLRDRDRDRDRDREQSKSCSGSQTQSQSGELNQNQDQNGDENGNGQAGSSGQGGSQNQNGSQNGDQNQNGSQNQNGRRAQAGVGSLSADLLARDCTRTTLRQRLQDGSCLIVAGVYIQKRDRDCEPAGDRQARDGHCVAA